MDLLNYEEDEEIIAQVEKSTKINSEEVLDLSSSSSSSLAHERRATEGSGQILRSFEESSLGASTSARRIASKLFNRQQDDSSKRTSTGFTSVSSLNKRQREDVPLTNNITDDKMIPLSSSHYPPPPPPPPPPPSVQYVDEKQSTSDFHHNKRMRRELGLTDSNLDKETLPSTHIVSAGSLRGEWRPSFQQNDSETVATGKNKVVGKMWSHETGTAVAVHELSRAAKSRHSIQSVAAAAIAASASLSAEHSVNIKTKAQTYAKYGW